MNTVVILTLIIHGKFVLIFYFVTHGRFRNRKASSHISSDSEIC